MKEKILIIKDKLTSRLSEINSKPMYAREGQTETMESLEIIELIEEINDKLDRLTAPSIKTPIPPWARVRKY